LHLAFASAATPTGYDNTDAVSGQPDSEVYLYAADGAGGPGDLACVSCNPSGARPSGREVPVLGPVSTPYWAASRLPGWPESQRPSRLLTSDGSRLFFNSFDALVSRDTNAKQDVYEWERSAGQAECTKAGAELYVAAAGGCLSLISAGQGNQDSEVIDASNGGADVFFTTGASLLPQDPSLIDVYDARAGGGFPIPLLPDKECEGNSCQAAGAVPSVPAPKSSAPGPGNPPQSIKCPKGKHKVTKHGKTSCVKNKAKKANKNRRAAR
jgi:hypothetical protein